MHDPHFWNIWCAICGGPVSSSYLYSQENGPQGYSFLDFGSTSNISWLSKTYVLGYNPQTAARNKFYLAKPSVVTGLNIRFSEREEDPAFPSARCSGLKAYNNEKGPERVIPFHKECYEILAKALTRTSDVANINKGALYRAFERVGVRRGFGQAGPEYRCLDLDYGDANEAQSYYWKRLSGKKYTVADPKYQGNLDDYLDTFISKERFGHKPLQLQHRDNPEPSPLIALPEPVIVGIAYYLDNRSLINLCCASWSTFLTLRDFHSFWRRRIRTHLPYFVELHGSLRHLREDPGGWDGLDLRRVLLWAEAVTSPNAALEQKMLPIANRRRIWQVCEQIKRLYDQEPQSKPTPQSMLQDKSVCTELQLLGDGQQGLYFRTGDFLRNWYELSDPWNLEIFWNSEWDLSGIAVNFGDDQRTFGHEAKEDGAWKSTASFSGGIWIKGFVFHIHTSTALRPWENCSWNYASCKGITVYLTDGSEHTSGQHGPGLMKMSFAAAEGMTIVGLKGILVAHKRLGVYPFIQKVGLLLTRTDGMDNPAVAPELQEHEGSCWNLKNCMFKSIFLPDGDMALRLCKGRLDDVDPGHNSVPLNTLNLADETTQLSQLRSISGYLVRDKHWFQSYTLFSSNVGNLRVSTNKGSRHLRDVDDDGSIWPEEHWETFEIDGPNGERIEQVDVYHDLFTGITPKAIKIQTNWERSVMWGEDIRQNKTEGLPSESHMTREGVRPPIKLRAEDGFAIVGLVMGCGKVCGRWKSPKDYMDEEEARGPWTKEQYDKRNEATLHTTMKSRFII
ncbi:Activator of stress related protein [Fusarium albosuccineum]|uniref:Activator of stress related protein n=1 Tax=Fusarium albosuccineum TaxID=1237068 RepID=A0A8H4PE53_9HYPO|nr:Activator of stress related protein [Fusarium albosuccineum]